MSSSPEKRHQKLKELIAYHDHAYHVLDRPEISDYEYDQLYTELLDLEKKHPELDRSDSPSQRVGSKPLDSFQKIDHRTPMLSLANSYSPEDIFEFDARVKKILNTEKKIEYFCEPKFDGLAIELIYEQGLLSRALTRGDGTTGEDVTQNIKTIRSIPLRLNCDHPPALLEVRGEVLIFKKDFQELNESQQEAGLQTFANPRNAAAGTVRQLDSKIAGSRPLKFFAYTLGAVEGFNFSNQFKMEKTLSKWGLPVCPENLKSLCLGSNEVVQFYSSIETKRENLPFDIDGIVIKVNDFQLQNDLGFVAKNPRWATAAKYKPQQAETFIEDIIVQVGRTGALTPVAIMTPVQVGGVTVTNATLHNQDEISRKDVRIGDSVLIQRAGDVIPEIVSVVLDKRKKGSRPFFIPEHCPQCNHKVARLEEEVVSRCMNPLCPAILKETLKHFVQRRAMNIDKVGDKIIDALFNVGLVTQFSDFYRLQKADLLKLERQGEKSAQNILESIEKSKKTTLARLIFAFGIRFVGEQTAKSLAEHFLTLEKFLQATSDELMCVPDIGPKVAQSILNWLQNKSATQDAQALIKLGVQVEQSRRNLTGVLAGKSFLITGTLPLHRDEAKNIIEQHGGKILSAVSSKLNYLVVGDDPGSKLEKAQSVGVSILSWDDVLQMVQHKEL